MFDTRDSARSQQLMAALDAINRRMGRDTVFYAGSGIKPRLGRVRQHENARLHNRLASDDGNQGLGARTTTGIPIFVLSKSLQSGCQSHFKRDIARTYDSINRSVQLLGQLEISICMTFQKRGSYDCHKC